MNDLLRERIDPKEKIQNENVNQKKITIVNQKENIQNKNVNQKKITIVNSKEKIQNENVNQKKNERDKIIQQTKKIQRRLMGKKKDKLKKNLTLIYFIYILRDNGGIKNLKEKIEKKIVNNSNNNNNEEIGELDSIKNTNVKNEIMNIMRGKSNVLNKMIKYYCLEEIRCEEEIKLIDFLNGIIEKNGEEITVDGEGDINNFFNIKYKPNRVNQYEIDEENKNYINIKDRKIYLNTKLFDKIYYFRNDPWRFCDSNGKNELVKKKMIVNDEERNYEIKEDDNVNENVKEYILLYDKDGWFWKDDNNEKLKLKDGEKEYIYKYDSILGWGWFCGEERLEVKRKGKIVLEPKGRRDLYHPPKEREIEMKERTLLILSTLWEGVKRKIKTIDQFMSLFRDIINILFANNCEDMNYEKITKKTIEYIKNRKGPNFSLI